MSEYLKKPHKLTFHEFDISSRVMFDFKVPILSSEGLTNAILEEQKKTPNDKEHPRGIYVKLGDYRLGQIVVSDANLHRPTFCITYSELYGETGIAAVLSKCFNRPLWISDFRMDTYLKNGVTLEELLEDTVANTPSDIIITSDPKTCLALLRSGYKKVMRIGEALNTYEGSFDKILFIKHTTLDRDECYFDDSFHINSSTKLHNIWFVRNTLPQHIESANELSIDSANQLKSWLHIQYEDSHHDSASDKNKPILRMYLGNYAIGGVSWNEQKECFEIGSTYSWPKDSFGDKLVEVCGDGILVTFDDMDKLLRNSHTIQGFFANTLLKHMDGAITDDDAEIKRLLENTYIPITALNDILRVDVRESLEHFSTYRKDARIVFIKKALWEIFHDEDK